MSMTNEERQQRTQVGNEIIRQLGGAGRLKAMINARNFSTNGNDVTFQFSMCPKAQYIHITLNNMDLYDLEFISIRKNPKTKDYDRKIPYEVSGIYFDQLKPIIEEFTGLRLSL